MTSLSTSDDFSHSPNKNPAWRESYYFNWVDIQRQISGFSTIGLLPNAEKREFVFSLFYEDKREVYWNEPSGPIPPDFEESLSYDKLLFKIVKPMKEWNIHYIGDEIEVNLKWRSRFPAYDFGTGSGTSWTGHFEQSGVVDGIVSLPTGQKLTIKGYGERDKSWGVRDWHIESWYAFHAQFKELSIGLRRDYVNGEHFASGAISTKDGHIPIGKVDVDTEYVDTPIKMPFKAKTTIHGEDGSKYDFISETLSPTSFVRFERDFSSGRTELFENMAHHHCEQLNEEGTGLLEWLFTHRK